MAASAITTAQAELISSLSQDDVPIKLRCAICSRLAVNAFRLPCCDQSICESCQSSLPSTCPVCEHSPVASEDCKPHKSLRTTIRVFLRTEEKKREALRAKEAKDTPPITPVEPEPTALAVSTPRSPTAPAANDAASGDITAEPALKADVTATSPENSEDIAKIQEAQRDIPQPSIEEIAPGQEPISEADAKAAVAVTEDVEGQKALTGMDAGGQPTGDVSQTPAFGAGFDFDGSAAAGYPGGFGGDVSQMQMMMAMQNGMAPNAFGNFPMMGMPGMSMDPMMMQNMQNMFMNGGFGAHMGVNGMLGGMGMGGFDGGGVGGGFNNGWNGQQSWNVAPDNFNHPNAAGMGPGDYGASNSGYAPHAAGYNQGNYGRGNQYNDYQNNNFSYRGRGRGRGGYGRGAYGYGSHEAHSQQYPQQFGAGNQNHGPISETGSIPTGPRVGATPVGNVDEFGREIRQTSEAKETPTESTEISKDDPTPAVGSAVNGDGVEDNVPKQPTEFQVEAEASTAPKPIQTLGEIQDSFAQTGHHGGYSNQYPAHGGFQQKRGGNFAAMQPPVKPALVPINAPTGPKAMREGLPNTSVHLLSRGSAIASPAISRVNDSASAAPEPIAKDDREKERSRSRTRERSRSRSRSRDRKRSRSRDRHRSHRHRHRSTSLSEDEKETERRRQRRKERRRRREEEDDDRDDTGSGDRLIDDGKDLDEDRSRSRSASLSDPKRSNHRSRRDKDKYRERERDSDREHRSSHKHRSSHRHRDDRSRSRDRTRDREHQHRHSRRGSEDIDSRTDRAETSHPPTPLEAEPSQRTSLISNGTNGIEIKGASSRRKNTLDELAIPTGPRSSRDRLAEKDHQASHRHQREDEQRRSSRTRDSDRDFATKEKERPKAPSSTTAPPAAAAAKNPHEEEREARNRERLLKEAQRMAGLAGGMVGARKRSRDEGGEDAGRWGKKGRRGVEESDEARVARLEAERESARW